jgi:hypothetical protein
VPLTKIQKDVLKLLASHRDPESYVAGVDVFHDREERVASAALADSKTLEAAGYQVSWLRQLPLIYTAEVIHGTDGTRLEWVVDSDFRFFPTIRDDLFGYILHPADLAMNKVMAAAGRREVRDLVDLITIHETILSLGAVIWAAVEKSPGFTPEGLIAEIRRNSNYPAAEWLALKTSEPVDSKNILARLRTALNEAEIFVARMPTEKMGMLFIKDGKVTQPDPDHLDSYEPHAGQRRGHWPTNPDTTAEMLARYTEGASREL